MELFGCPRGAGGVPAEAVRQCGSRGRREVQWRARDFPMSSSSGLEKVNSSIAASSP